MPVIDIKNLLFMLIPIAIVWYFYAKWSGDIKEVGIATFRMVLQLLVIGYVLVYIFNNHNAFIGLFVLLVMISISSLIALRNVKKKDIKMYGKFFISILIGGSLNLLLSLYFVLDLSPLYQPKYIIPLAGMVFANAMNAISLTAERFEREKTLGSYEQARAIALKSSLIPQINAFLAVGLVSLPGMMTGQILSGVDPVIAVRYQIMVMGMILGSAGISSVIYLYLQKNNMEI